ncbi:AAA domain-containing protein [Agrobacterium tumefaciens]|nr:AAA domain-containing protein [Agrobacterium tumefaciens]
MKVNEITESSEVFSYKSQRFSNKRYILATREERNEHYIIPIVAIDNGQIVDLDDYEFGNNVFAARPSLNAPQHLEHLPLTRFYINQLIKVDYGTIVPNAGAENPYAPKIKTYNSNIHDFEADQVIEFFEGNLNERQSLFTPSSAEIFELIKDVYVENQNSFFIIYLEKIIGPFLALKVNDNSFEITKSSLKTFGVYAWTDNTFIEFEANNITRRVYLSESATLNLEYSDTFKFVSDSDLLKDFESELQKYPERFTFDSLVSLKKTLDSAKEIKSLGDYLNGNERLSDLISKSDKVLTVNIDLLNLFPSVKEKKEEKEKVDESVFFIRQEIDRNKIELTEILNDKETLQNEINDLEQTKQDELDKRRNDLDQEITELTEKKKNLKSNIIEEEKSLHSELTKIHEDIKHYDRHKKELQDTIEHLRDEFREEQKQAQLSLQNLVKSKVHFDFISGRDLSEQDEKMIQRKLCSVTDQYTKSQYREFRNDLLAVLRQHNRNFETHFVDNLLISVFQNTLTLFAGVPGTGKTTLARILTQILTPKQRIREISVSRGWTSQKDFIGFVNPLTKKVHSSATDFYPLLEQLNFESESPASFLQCPIAFVVLDEANLSPLEHYWSSFYNLTDSGGMLQIKLGDKEVINYPNNLRFIGTINYDHTTEELSPRILDRVNVIQLDKFSDLNINNLSNAGISNLQLTFQRCIDFFELTDFGNVKLNFEDKTDVSFKEIKNEFRALKIFISNRVEIAIKRYISLASKYMTDVNKPLDYCVAQRLLPLINLHGSEHKLKLDSLREKLRENKCEISVKILDDIISTGSEKGLYEDNFNYFLTLSNV